MTPGLLCYLQWMILVLDSGALSHGPAYVKWFRSLGKMMVMIISWGNSMLAEWSYAHFAWDIWHVSEWWCQFSTQECCYHQSFLVPWSQYLWELKNSLRSLDDWWGDRWRLVAQVHAFGPLARGHKALNLSKWGKRCLMIDSAFSDNAHTTMQPRSVDNKDTTWKIFLNYRTL